MVVGSLAVLFAALVSPPPLTAAVLVMLAGALAATLTVTVMEGKLALAASASLRVQVSVGTSQLHPEPDIPAVPTRRSSDLTTVTIPELGPVPLLLTVIVYVAPTWP